MFKNLNKRMSIVFVGIIFLSLLVPSLVFAQTPAPVPGIIARGTNLVCGTLLSIGWGGKTCQFAMSYAKTGSVSGAVVDMASGVASGAATSITGNVLAFSAFVFDYSAYFALQGASYGNSAVVSSWVVLRDVVNVIFIFLLLFVAFIFKKQASCIIL